MGRFPSDTGSADEAVTPVSRQLPDSFRNQRVTIMGLGRFGGGVSVARYLAGHGAELHITDLWSADRLSESIAQLKSAGVDATFSLGGHPDEAFAGCDVLVVNPGVAPGNSAVEQCRGRGVLVTSEIELFTARCPALTIAVTGSNGKSTVCRLIHDLLKSRLPADRRVFLGGNIGYSLLGELNRIRASDVVILELSSFQLHQLRDSTFSPDVAVVTNLSPNHLDWHPDLQHYRKCKQVLTARQPSGGTTVLPTDLDDWPVRCRCLRFGVVDTGEDGVFLEQGSLILRVGDRETAERITLPAAFSGRHHRQNLTAAFAAVRATFDTEYDVAAVARDFQGLPHRMQIVDRGNGRIFIDDSCSTTPESTIAALQSLSSPCVLIVGGADKGLDMTDLARQIGQSVDRVVAIGNTAPSLIEKICLQSPSGSSGQFLEADDFDTAFTRAVDLTRPGDIVLLSPGCSSHDWFADFRERGHTFSRLAREWCAAQEEDT